MRRFVEGVDRQQSTLFPECLEDWICEDNPVRVIDVFVAGLGLAELYFGGIPIRCNREVRCCAPRISVVGEQVHSFRKRVNLGRGT